MIGLLGGSFNPAHRGHREVAERALKALGLDEVWLLVSPGNPLKPADGMAAFPARFASAAKIADGRRILAVDLEEAWHTRFTRDTLKLLGRRFPRTRFVWLMGADVLAELPRWRRWEDVVRRVAVAVLPRPGFTRRALAGCAARRFAAARLPRGAGRLLRRRPPPAWIFLGGPTNPASASEIRRHAIRTRERGERAIAKLPPDDLTWRTRRKPPGERRVEKRGETLGARKAAPPLPAGSVPAAGGVRQKAAAAGPAARPEADPPATPPRTAPGKRPGKLPGQPIGGEPAPKGRRRAAASRLEALQRLVLASLEDDKAGDVAVLDLVGRASFADRMVIATGLSDRQIATMARHLEERLKEAGLPRLAIEGRKGADWVLVDAGDIVVHLFKPEARALYALERMWGAELGPEEHLSAG